MAADAMPEKVTRKLYRGNTRRWTHVIERNVGTTAVPIWEAVDVTGWEFIAQYRENLDRGTIVATSTCAVTDGPNGMVEEYLPKAQADLLPGQEDPTVKPVVYWDLQSTDTDGEVQTWKYAFVPVTGDASHV